MPLACLLRVLQLVEVAMRLGSLGLSGPLVPKCTADCIPDCPGAYHPFCVIQFLQ